MGGEGEGKDSVGREDLTERQMGRREEWEGR